MFLAGVPGAIAPAHAQIAGPVAGSGGDGPNGAGGAGGMPGMNGQSGTGPGAGMGGAAGSDVRVPPLTGTNGGNAGTYGNGGAGGGGGTSIAGTSTTLNNPLGTTLSGGDGGTISGGGGAGGYGAVVTTGGGSNAGTIRGGSGGSAMGLAGSNAGGGGGNGGDGGGALFLGSNITFANSGTISGGGPTVVIINGMPIAVASVSAPGGNLPYKGGDGGRGSAGVEFAGASSTLNATGGSITGGRGGTGGGGGNNPDAGGIGAVGGAGGGGGAGVAFDLANGVLNNTGGTVMGGAGGNGEYGGDNINTAGGIGGMGGAGAAGGAGVAFAASNGTVVNTGTITGGAGGRSFGGGAGRFMDSEFPRVPGGTGGAGGDGGNGGAGISFVGTGNMLTNTGTIAGGNGAASGMGGLGANGVRGASGTAGLGGVGAVGSDLTIFNSGTIAGGLSGATAPSRANAVTFTGGTNNYTLAPGSTTTGNVVAFSTLDTIGLGGTGAGSFDMSQLGAANSGVQYQGFGIFQKTGTSLFTITGTPGTDLSVYQVNDGVLRLGNAGVLGTSGTISFAGGTLQAGVTGLTFSNGLTFNPAGGTVDSNGKTITFSGDMTFGGTGAFNVVDSTGTNTGVVIVSGANADGGLATGFSGPTNVMSGTLRTGSTYGFSSQSAYTISANGTLDLNGFFQAIGSLAGTGLVTNTGGGATGLTTGFDNRSTDFGGVIANGNGQMRVNKYGSGTQTLSGTNTYTGPTTIYGGRLNVTGSIATSASTVNTGGALSGTGTVGSVTVNNGGTLSPGVSGVGMLTANAPVGFNAGSFYNISITPTTNSSTTITGTASLGGATVRLFASGGTYTSNTRYTILTASGGLGGSMFDPTVSTASAFLMPTLSYDATHAYLTVLPTNPTTAGTVDYRGAAATSNQFGLASGLTYAGILAGANANNPVLNGLNQLTAAQAQYAFDSLTGEGITGAQNVALRASHLFTSAITDLMVFYGGGANSVIVPTGPTIVPLQYAPTRALAPQIAVRDPVASRPLYSWRAWGTGYGASETIRANPVIGYARQDNGVGGGAVGVDYNWAPGMISGVALGGSDGSFSVGARNTHGSTTGGHAAFYTFANFGPIYVASVSSVSYFGNRTTRNIAGFGGLAPETERGNYTSSESRSRMEFGYRLPPFGSAMVTPFFAVEAARLRSNGFNETSVAGVGLFALNVRGQSVSSVPMSAGARITGAWDLGNGMWLRPSVQAAYVHEFAPVRNQVGGLISLPGSVFLTDGARPARDAAQVKAGAELAVLENVSLSANFDGELSGRSNTYAGKGAVKVNW